MRPSGGPLRTLSSPPPDDEIIARDQCIQGEAGANMRRHGPFQRPLCRAAADRSRAPCRAGERGASRARYRAAGLVREEAARRLERPWPQRDCPTLAGRHPLLRFLSQFNNALIYLLLAAAWRPLALGHFVDAAVIVAVVLVNAVVGYRPGGQGREGSGGDPPHDRAAGACAAGGPPRASRRWPSSCPATSCCWRPATGCPPICGSCARAGC